MKAQVKAVGTIYILDDDVHVRQGLENLLRSMEFHVVSFASVPEFLKNVGPDARGCLVLDVRLPGPSGLDLQAELKRLNIEIPIVFITGTPTFAGGVEPLLVGDAGRLLEPLHQRSFLRLRGPPVEIQQTTAGVGSRADAVRVLGRMHLGPERDVRKMGWSMRLTRPASTTGSSREIWIGRA